MFLQSTFLREFKYFKNNMLFSNKLVHTNKIKFKCRNSIIQNTNSILVIHIGNMH